MIILFDIDNASNKLFQINSDPKKTIRRSLLLHMHANYYRLENTKTYHGFSKYYYQMLHSHIMPTGSTPIDGKRDCNRNGFCHHLQAEMF